LIGFVVGGLPGSRLLARLAITTSDDTVLRRVKIRPLSDAHEDPIRSLGVDDWAWRKGQDYGTILVDLDRHRVADLLPGRSAEELKEWLTQHPTVNVISRDRSGIYAEGSQLGAPDATQVADRFHLVLNMSAAIEKALEERSSQLQLPAAKPSAPEQAQPEDPLRSKATLQETRKQQRRQRRLGRYEQVVQLHREEHSQKAISQALEMQRKTVRRWLRAGQFPERKPGPKTPQGTRVRRISSATMGRGLSQCHQALSGDSKSGLPRAAQHGGAVRFRLEKTRPSISTGSPAANRTQARCHLDHQISRSTDGRAAVAF
jgi:hypothetical protein